VRVLAGLGVAVCGPLVLLLSLGGVAGADCVGSSSVGPVGESGGQHVLTGTATVTAFQSLLAVPGSGFVYRLESFTVVMSVAGQRVELFDPVSNAIFGTRGADASFSGEGTAVNGELVGTALDVLSTSANFYSWTLSYDVVAVPASTNGATACEMVSVQGFAPADLDAFCGVVVLALGVLLVKAFRPS
jgi:hypothetical protein